LNDVEKYKKRKVTYNKYSIGARHMNNIEDIKKYITVEYGVDPVEYDGETLKYHSITFKRNTGSVILANKQTGDMWTVARTGHTIDFFRTEELKEAIGQGGSLLYFFIPKERA